MKKIIALVFVAILGMAVTLGAQKSAPPTARVPRAIEHVIIVSVDGLMPESYTKADEHGLKIPLMRQIMAEGAYSEGVESVFPTLTYPAHTTMATGTNPGTHGIVLNPAWDPMEKNKAGWRWYTEDIRVPTLWDVARARGLKTALVWWPVTVGAQANALVPEYWRASTPDDLKLWRALSTRSVFEELNKRYPNFCGDCVLPNPPDARIADIATTIIETERPNLLMIHMPELDHVEHDYGPFSPAALGAIENADVQIARLVASAKKAGIWEHTALVILSDHGFAPVSHDVRPGVLMSSKGLITLDKKNHIEDWKAVVLTSGASAYVYVKDPDDEATRKALLDIFEPLAGTEGSGIGRVLNHEQITAMGGDPEAFLALEAAKDFGMTYGYTGDYIEPSKVVGTHGYFPDQPAMRASLLVFGPSIGSVKIADARLLDVAPTVARWLGLELEKAEGKPLDIPVRNTAN